MKRHTELALRTGESSNIIRDVGFNKPQVDQSDFTEGKNTMWGTNFWRGRSQCDADVLHECRRAVYSTSIYLSSTNGWMKESFFLAWLEHFAKHATRKKESPVLLILDGHCSHKEIKVILYCDALAIERGKRG
ncbi:hypothetical protein PR048_006302 [Dryococelus australis]|uniref:DDE-1 domain-containing protein n=1 Tax=Dryococelus australis TaxID=614101 RepID=A0ABQ9IAL0_9NEOP|nr:hypothetical protein PR048_006302 [Dryococelus australis]